MSRSPRLTSIRWSLLRSFVILILLTSATVLVTMWIQAPETERRLSSEMIQRGTKRARQELDGFFDPARKGCAMALRWGRAGKLSLDAVVDGQVGEFTDEQSEAALALNTLLLPYLDAYPRLSSVQVANERGEGFLLLRLPDGSLSNRVVRRAHWGVQALRLDVSDDGMPTAWTWADEDYDPRGRAWYTILADAEPAEIRWTPPYVFFTTHDLGVTASTRWTEHGVQHVVAIDVLLTALTEFTQDPANQATKSAQTLIATEDWGCMGLPGSARSMDAATREGAFLKRPSDLGLPIYTDASRSARVHLTENETEDATFTVFPFESGDEGWWAGIRRYDLDESQRLWIALVVPNSELLEALTRQRNILLGATGAALLAALLYSLLLARSYSRPLEALARQSRRISDLDFRTEAPIRVRLRELDDLAEAQAHSLAAAQSFSRYVPVDVVRELIGEGQVARIGGRTADLTVLFTDIAGFTRISEGMSPQDLTLHMADYFEAMFDALQATGATVDKMVGDAIVAFWGAPRPLEDREGRALQAILACQDRLRTLGEEWTAKGLPPLPTRFGLATGPVVVGNIGSPSRLAYTVLGDTVNFASRLESINKAYGTYVLADQAVHTAGGERYVWRRLDRIVVVGKTEPTWIFELLGRTDVVAPEAIEAARAYESAWDAYAARDFAGASTLLDGIDAAYADDAVRRLSDLAAEYARTPPPPEFDGTTWMTKK